MARSRPTAGPRPAPAFRLPDSAEFWDQIFREYGSPSVDIKRFLAGKVDVSKLTGAAKRAAEERLLSGAFDAWKNRKWLNAADSRMGRQVLLGAPPRFLTKPYLAELHGQVQLARDLSSPQLRMSGGLQGNLENLARTMQEGTSRIPGISDMDAFSFGKKAYQATQDALLGLNAISPVSFRRVLDVRNRTVDRLVTPSREVLERVGQELQANFGTILKGVNGYQYLRNAGLAVRELQKALARTGHSLLPWGAKPLFRFASAGKKLAGHFSVTDFTDPVAGLKWWMHIRKDALRTGLRTLRDGKVRAAITKVYRDYGAWIPKSVGILTKLVRNLRPLTILRNAGAALLPPARRVFRRAFGSSVPDVKRVGAIAKIVSKIGSYFSFLSFVKGKDRWSFPSSLILPGPLGIVFAIGRMIFGKKKARKKRLAAAAAAMAQAAFQARQFSMAQAAYKRAVLKKIHRARKGVQSRRSRINALLVRLGVRP